MVIETSKTLNVKAEQMRSVAESSSIGAGLMMWLALRDRHSNDFKMQPTYSKILRQGFKGDIQDLYDAVEMLQEIGLGSLVYAKKGSGQDDSFKWDYNLTHHCHKAFSKEFLEKIKESGEYPEFYTRKDFIPNKKPAAVAESKGITFKELNSLKANIPMRKAPGRPKGSKNKATLEGVVVPAALTKSLVPSQNDRYLNIPLKNKRDIRIQMPADITSDELALLNLTLGELTKAG